MAEEKHTPRFSSMRSKRVKRLPVEYTLEKAKTLLRERWHHMAFSEFEKGQTKLQWLETHLEKAWPAYTSDPDGYVFQLHDDRHGIPLRQKTEMLQLPGDVIRDVLTVIYRACHDPKSFPCCR